MTALDHRQPPPGYYPSVWPGECGGPRRQKLAGSPGPGLQPGERLASTVRDTGGWPVMVVQRGAGELYLQGGAPLLPDLSAPAYRSEGSSAGWLERIDPLSLEPVHRSPDLPSGGWLWCGAAVVHANGDIYVVNGRFCHRLGPTCDVRAERELPVDGPYNGALIMADGNLLTRNLGFRDGDPATFSVLEPAGLRDVGEPLVHPEPCMGRWSADRSADGTELVYFTTATEVRRLRYRNGRLALDESWRASYAVTDGQSDGWDTAIGDRSVWLMDMGRPAGWGRPGTAGQRAFRFSAHDAHDHDVIDAIGMPNAWNPGPPLYDPLRRVLVHYDSANGVIVAHRYAGPGDLQELWRHYFRNFVQMLCWADTGELVVEDARAPQLEMGGETADLVVLDIETGRERGRAPIGMPATFGMFCCPGFDRDVYVTGIPGGVARVYVA